MNIPTNLFLMKKRPSYRQYGWFRLTSVLEIFSKQQLFVEIMRGQVWENILRNVIGRFGIEQYKRKSGLNAFITHAGYHILSRGCIYEI